MALFRHIRNPTPGPERLSRAADYIGEIHFKSEKAGIEGETAYWIRGDLSFGKCPLIALHGGPSATHSNMIPISLIADDCGILVVVYDQIGCGESTRFKERNGDAQLWTAELFMYELLNVIDWLRNVESSRETGKEQIGNHIGNQTGSIFTTKFSGSLGREYVRLYNSLCS